MILVFLAGVTVSTRRLLMSSRRDQQQKKLDKALEAMSKVFGETNVDLPLESTLDIIREAASVIQYFDMHEKFKTEICRNCKQEFAYGYYVTAVKYCSIPCMAAALAEIGLSWDPGKPAEQRWGRYVPAIVPPLAHEVIKEQKAHIQTNGHKPSAGVDDLLNIIKSVGL